MNWNRFQYLVGAVMFSTLAIVTDRVGTTGGITTMLCIMAVASCITWIIYG